MRNLRPLDGLIQAIKANALSLTAWQLGMFGFMAIARFILAARVWKHSIDPTMPAFWFLMQIAMIVGLITSYPVNWWLIRVGIKEVM